MVTHVTKSVSVITRVAPDVKEKLQAIAKSTKRSEAFLAREAIEAFVERESWYVRQIQEGLEAVRAGEPGIPHEDVLRWLESSRKDQARPKAKRRR